jgi:FAD/FMN-containing dehydrogenase
LVNLNLPVFYPDSAIYTESIDSYWSATAQLTPWCVVTPRDAVEVSAIVKALSTGTEQCEFAVRSGGHMPWAGASDIENGVTIDLGLMNSTTVNVNDTATVLPGATWGDVYSTLDAQNLATSGGRASTVGAGGLVIGGGNSFYAARKGFVCDNVAQFEVSGMLNANEDFSYLLRLFSPLAT